MSTSKKRPFTDAEAQPDGVRKSHPPCHRKVMAKVKHRLMGLHDSFHITSERDQTDLHMDITTFRTLKSRQPLSLWTLLMKLTTTRPLLLALTWISCYFPALGLKDLAYPDQLIQARSMIWNHLLMTHNPLRRDITSQSRIRHSILTPSHGTSNSSMEDLFNIP